MKYKKWILITSLCLFIGTLGSPLGLYASGLDNQGSQPKVPEASARGFSSLAVDTVRPASFTFDSPLMRITGMYGVGHQAFLENIEHLELVAITSNEMDIPYIRATDPNMKRLSSNWLNSTSKTAQQFREAQQKFITAHHEDQGYDGPVIGVAAEGRNAIVDHLPEVMSDKQFVSFHDLSLEADEHSSRDCSCSHDCAVCTHEEHSCDVLEEEDSCLIDTCGEEQSCCDCCCDCCCLRIEKKSG